jgi:hypothetical protein
MKGNRVPVTIESPARKKATKYGETGRPPHERLAGFTVLNKREASQRHPFNAETFPSFGKGRGKDPAFQERTGVK